MYGEALINLIHREALRVLHRNTRRTPVVVDSYDPKTYAAKFKLMPDSVEKDVVTGWIPLHTLQSGNNFGWHSPPNVGDHGWLDFHEDDREGGTFTAATFNDKFKPIETQAGEMQYVTKWGHTVYMKNDGSITLKNGNKSGADGNGTSKQSTIVLDQNGNVTVTADSSGTITFKAQKIVHDGSVYLGGADASNAVGMLGSTDSDGTPLQSNLATKVFAK